jgi:hypothetical protein
MTTANFSPADLVRVAHEAVVGFRGIRPDETPAAFAQAAALHALQQFIETHGGQVTNLSNEMPVLLARANLDAFALHSKVVHSTDKIGRVMVRSSGFEPWRDCVHLNLMREGEDSWFGLHLSPARARVVAHLLVQAAEHREANDPGMRCIDQRPSEK